MKNINFDQCNLTGADVTVYFYNYYRNDKKYLGHCN
jgi:hypothetical protein